jgi:hypothetical protein
MKSRQQRGIRDLDGDFKAFHVKPTTEPVTWSDPAAPEPYVLTPDICEVSDLLYDGDATGILEAFPNAKITRDYDEVHGERLDITIPDTDLNEWLYFVITTGRGSISFGLQLRLRAGEKPDIERLEAILARIKAEGK